MILEVWLAYIVTAAVIVVIPGPTVLLVVARAITHGRRSVMWLVLGVTLGDIAALLLSFIGLGALLALSAELFNLVKWAGAAYLVYLGISLWREKSEVPGSSALTESRHPSAMSSGTSRKMVWDSFIVTTFNPKGIIFFISFLPQFVTPYGNVELQLAILGVTFVLVGSLSAMMYAAFSSTLQQFLQKGKARRRFNRCGGAALVGAGVFAASAQRA